MYEIAHAVTGSLLCAQWPPVDGQRMVGTHSPANMGLTSRWAAAKNKDGNVRCVAVSHRLLGCSVLSGGVT